MGTEEQLELRTRVGEMLKALRHTHDLTVHQVAFNYARLSGKDPEKSDLRGYISKAEHGALLPKRPTLLQLGKAVRATDDELDLLLTTAGYLPERREAPPTEAIQALQFWLKDAQDLSEQGKRQVIEFAKRIQEEERQSGKE